MRYKRPSELSTALYFMPDISGFTKFVAQTEIEHSLHIMQELFQVLLQENSLKFQLIEIEGDALFFYSQNKPTYDAIELQVLRMLQAFHEQIALYEEKRICNCGACMSAVNLKLKFILHVGSLSFLAISGQKKPFGHDVILTHRLLKNEAPINQYLLMSESAWLQYKPWDNASYTQKTTTMDLGEVTYYYKRLATPTLKRKPEVGSTEALPTKQKKPDLRIEREFDVPQPLLFEYISNLDKRSLWDFVPEYLEFEPERVNREGTRHNCIVGSRKLSFKTGKVTPRIETEQVYSEFTEDYTYLKKYQYYLLLNAISTKKTNVEVIIFIQGNLLGRLAWIMFIKRRLKQNWIENLERLSELLTKSYINP